MSAPSLLDVLEAHEPELWHTPEGNPGISLTVTGVRCHMALKSAETLDLLKALYYAQVGQPIKAGALRDGVGVLRASARFEGAQVLTYLRVAVSGPYYYLHIANAARESVRIGPAGWDIVSSQSCPVIFLPRPGGELPYPRRGGQIQQLAGLLGLDSDSSEWATVVTWLIGCLRPRGPYPVLELTGDYGSGKSTCARMLRGLIDPSPSPLRAPPSHIRDLFVTATHNWINVYDNVSRLPQNLSDALCQVATGGGHGARALYSDGREFATSVCRPQMVTAISNVITALDLSDRTVTVRLPNRSGRYRTEDELWAEYAAHSGEILGALLDAAVYGLQALPVTQVSNLPRMADFATWACACAPALGLTQKRVLDALAQSRTELTSAALDSSLVAELVLVLLRSCKAWSGTATELYRALAPLLPQFPGYRGWPTNPQQLSAELARVAPALAERGISVRRPRRTKSARLWNLELLEARRSLALHHGSDDRAEAV